MSCNSYWQYFFCISIKTVKVLLSANRGFFNFEIMGKWSSFFLANIIDEKLTFWKHKLLFDVAKYNVTDFLQHLHYAVCGWKKNVLSWPWEDFVICVTPVSTILQLSVYIDFAYCFVCHLTFRKMNVASFLGNQGSGSLWFTWSCSNQTGNLKFWPCLVPLSPSDPFSSAAHLHSALVNWWRSCMEAPSLDKNCSGWKEPVWFVAGVV